MNRCQWVINRPEFYIAYHDYEWGRPEKNEQKLFEILTLEIFQAGLSFETVLKKRDSFRDVFMHFDIEKVGAINESDITRLLGNERIIRHRGKILATVNNAQCILKLHERGINFNDFVWNVVGNQPQRQLVTNEIPEVVFDLVQILKKAGFKFIGIKTVESFMQAAGLLNAHTVDCALMA